MTNVLYENWYQYSIGTNEVLRVLLTKVSPMNLIASVIDGDVVNIQVEQGKYISYDGTYSIIPTNFIAHTTACVQPLSFTVQTTGNILVFPGGSTSVTLVPASKLPVADQSGSVLIIAILLIIVLVIVFMFLRYFLAAFFFAEAVSLMSGPVYNPSIYNPRYL